MIDLLDLIRRRSAGGARIALVRDHAATLDDQILAKFGLRMQYGQLTACDRTQATTALSRLLGRDMAYDTELMSDADAMTAAQAFIEACAQPGAIFHSNLDRKVDGAYVPMTGATFDSGIIVSNPDSTHICIWFEDED